MPWPGRLPHTARRSSVSNCSSNGWSGLLPRRTARASSSSSENRQFRTAPSAVRRRRLQVPQNGRVTLEMTPISPRRRRTGTARAGAGSALADRVERPAGADPPEHLGTRDHPVAVATCPSASRGMNSMNRTVRPVRRAKAAKSSISSSLTPRIEHDVHLDGPSPAASAASIARAPWRGRRDDGSFANRSGRSVSQLTLTRSSPAAARAGACRASSMPLVVRARSAKSRSPTAEPPGRRGPRRRAARLRSVGSWSHPDLRATLATRVISSKVRSDRGGRNGSPPPACSRCTADCSGR